MIAGASGFVGRHMVDALLDEGHDVGCGTRDVARARQIRPDLDWIALDLGRPPTVQAALEGADALVYLVHQMRQHDGADLVELERATAQGVREAAVSAGLSRIVYLGAPAPDGPASPHLAARLATGAELRQSDRDGIPAVELQASMIIGQGSESWLMVRDLALRLPVMVLPRWLRTRSRPIGIDDVVAALMRSLTLETERSLCLGLPGPEILSAKQILLRVAAIDGRRPRTLPVPILTPRLSAAWIRLVTRADMEVATQLVEGLTADLVGVGEGFWDHQPDLQRTPVDVAIRRALDAEPAQPGLMGRWEALARRLAPYR